MEPKILSIADHAKTALAILQDLTEKPGKNSSSLLKNPAASTHPSWNLWLPPHFNSALDLRFLQKQKTKNKEVVAVWKEWVQGGRFQFNEGSILYDRDVAALATWGEKLATIDFYVLIHAARPVTVKPGKEEDAGARAMRRHPGLVSFAIHTTKPSGSQQVSREITMSQDEFVRFAITGQQ
ncbi:MAG: hypothetical protein ACK6BG_15050 [Cyanobacteriota bacterium]